MYDYWFHDNSFSHFDTGNSADFDSDETGCFGIAVLLLAFLISGGFAFQDFRYFAFGKDVDATVVRVRDPIPRVQNGYEVRYSFNDPLTNSTREESDVIPTDWGSPSHSVPVRYLAAKPGSSRIRGARGHFALWVFAATSILAFGGVLYLYLDARRALAPRKPSPGGHRRHHHCESDLPGRQ